MKNDFDTNFLNTKDPFLNAICKYRKFPSVIMNKEKKKQIE